MTLAQYNAIEAAFMQMQYFSYAKQHKDIDFPQYCVDVYTSSDLAVNFRRTWGWVSYLGLESVVEGE